MDEFRNNLDAIETNLPERIDSAVNDGTQEQPSNRQQSRVTISDNGDAAKLNIPHEHKLNQNQEPKFLGRKLEDLQTRLEEGQQDYLFELKATIDHSTKHLHSKIDRVEATVDVIRNIQQKCNADRISTVQDDYDVKCKEFLDVLIEHYRKTLSTVSISPIWDGHDKPIHTVFVQQKLIYITIENDGSRRKTNNEVLQYKELFYKGNKLNKRVILQGESGMGKTTLLSKIVLDWCEAASPESQENSAKCSDLETLYGFKFLFHLTLRDSPETLEVVKMIRTQLIDKMYADEDERKEVYKLLQHIMKKEKCIICMDGLNEWANNLNTDPFPLIATCHKQCVALITTRPWKMADKRIKDSSIDLLIEVSGILDKEQLAKFVLQSLQTNNTKSNSEFMSYVKEHKLEHFLESPWLLTLLVSVWLNSQHFSGSLCEMNCILLDNLFRKAAKHEGYFIDAQFRCLKGTKYIYPCVEILYSLAKLAFECTFSSEKSLVFCKEKVLECLSQEHLRFSLQAGVLSERYISSLQSQFSFLHETVQEFLAAFHIATSNDISILSILGNNIRQMLEISQVYIYLCGLNTDKANQLLDPAVQDLHGAMSHGLRMYVKRMYNKKNESEVKTDNTNLINIVTANDNDIEFDSSCVSIAILFQSMLIAGFREAEASEQNVSYLVCNDFIFHEYLNDSESVYLKSMLMNNTSCIRSLILHSYILQEKEILTILQMSKSFLVRLVIPGNHKVCTALRDLKLTELVLKTCINIPVLSDVMPSLDILNYLQITECNLHDEIRVPVGLKHLSLYCITCSARFMSMLLLRLSSLVRRIRCDLLSCSVASEDHQTSHAYDGTHTDISVLQRELCACDLSNVKLLVENGNRKLFDLLHGTRIGALTLVTSDDVSFAADILHTLCKLEKLNIWGTITDLCAIQLPPMLQVLSLHRVICSTEWLGSLLIQLSSLQYQVECVLIDNAVNTSYEADGQDTVLSVARSKLLSCDMSHVELGVGNGSSDLYELLRGTSIGAFTLATSDDVSLAADILPTLNNLKKLNILGTFKDRCAIQLPPKLQVLSLQRVICSTEWLGSLLIQLSSLQYQVECVLIDNAVNTSYEADGQDTVLSVARSKLLSCDMSHVELGVSNGSRDLYEQLRGTSIGALTLATSDDVSLAADILPTLNNLKKLNILGTFKDRCAIQLPPKLQVLSMQEGECSTEWLGSLFIQLSSLQHQVDCNFFDIAVNTSYAADGQDTALSVARRELLSCDMSHVTLYASNGSSDLYELLRGTSIGALTLATSDDVSLAADILPTLNNLKKN
ncbi:uncharacterized protein LOC127850050 isoform X2 [Dreissena polymorpha]|uniref:uncharacterized protein LOC127850050 isoform X2 n=1 Tax=Dreissena polymorpha TaxID=45954 RepID=UPI0022648EB8|nr:uncharacterized protein LOC127850050 isoform X2 [Dreissena polymorpha]